jgi:DNA mismatch endonuclease, patch repair protein
MRANRRISGAEIRFRRALWAVGARGFRRGDHLPGRPDIIFSSLRLAVFVHGCFWHRCPTCGLRAPVANAEFWRAKFEANLARDDAARRGLDQIGWEVLTIWEHDLRHDVQASATKLAEYVSDLRTRR